MKEVCVYSASIRKIYVFELTKHTINGKSPNLRIFSNFTANGLIVIIGHLLFSDLCLQLQQNQSRCNVS